MPVAYLYLFMCTSLVWAFRCSTSDIWIGDFYFSSVICLPFYIRRSVVRLLNSVNTQLSMNYFVFWAVKFDCPSSSCTCPLKIIPFGLIWYFISLVAHPEVICEPWLFQQGNHLWGLFLICRSVMSWCQQKFSHPVQQRSCRRMEWASFEEIWKHGYDKLDIFF